MKLEQLFQSLLVTGSFFVLVTTPALSEEGRDDVQRSFPSTSASTSSDEALPRSTSAGQVQPIIEVQPLSKLKRPPTSGQKLVQSPVPTPGSAASQEVIQITGVKANPTEKGVEVILQTSNGEQLQISNVSTGNSYIADIPNAQLRLPNGDGFVFRSEKPTAGISEITVTNQNVNTVRVTVTGEVGLPQAELFDGDEGLIFGLTPAASTTQLPPQPEAPQNSEPEKPASNTPPAEPSGQTDEPIELLVTGEQDGYRVPDAATATKTDTPLRDIPQSIQVVPRQVLEDQQVTNLGEALRNVSGVSQGDGSRSRGAANTPRIRGFDSRFDILTNGLKDSTNLLFGYDPAIIDRIEVLKGPASVLYGQGSTGGVINLVTKQPLRDPFYSVEFSAGNYNFYRGGIDLSGPLNDDKTVLYRLNVAAQTTESFVDFYDGQQYIVAPSLSWQISDRTKLTLSSEYINRPKDFGQMGIPVVGSILPNPNGRINRDRNFSEPSSRDDLEVFRVGYDLEHRFSENWQLRSVLKAGWADQDRVVTQGTSLRADNRTLNRIFFESDIDDRVFNFDNYVVGKFATGSIQHQLVTGFNLTRLDTRNVDLAFNLAAPIDVFNPEYGQPLGESIGPETLELGTNAYGFYVQDQITVTENFKVLIGGRFDIINQKFENFTASTSESVQQEAFSPRVGIVYQPIPPISLYASYSRAFSPNQSVFSPTLPEPERGTQYEVGIKADFSERLAATLAFYDLTRSNVLVADPNNIARSIQVGEQKSQGIEFDLSGEISPGWNIIAGYAYTDTEITEDEPSRVGNQLNNVPKHSWNLWTTYELQSGNLKGLGFGLGLFYVGDRQGDLANTFELPSYVRTDAAIFYKQDRFRAALNFKNIFNIDYWDSALNRANVYPGDPFIVQGTVSFQL
ncbi:TonB-dependent siderophore receptor [Nostoc sp. CALU 546]|uniref:TonB-dependent siderophore receptor n=1 Tax=Nostoc sp. CALU 546 TaxID=1867241 RepID=UPI003B68593D